MNDDSAREREIETLRRSARLVLLWLVLLTLLSLSLVVAFLTKVTVLGITDFSTQRILLCVVAGTLGSCISALLSAAERISHGWEFSEGEKYPSPEPKDKFVARMVPFFIVRPFLGSAMGLLVFAGVTSGYLIAVENAQQATFSRPGLLFLSFLGGLFLRRRSLRDCVRCSTPSSGSDSTCRPTRRCSRQSPPSSRFGRSLQLSAGDVIFSQ